MLGLVEPDDIRRLAQCYADAAEELRRHQQVMGRSVVAAQWVSSAATRFRRSAQDHVRYVGESAVHLDEAAGALRALAGEVADREAEIAHLLQLAHEAAERTARAVSDAASAAAHATASAAHATVNATADAARSAAHAADVAARDTANAAADAARAAERNIHEKLDGLADKVHFW